MSYQIELQRPNLLYFRLHGVVTLDEVRALARAINTIFEQAAYPIHMIGDMLDLESYPTHLRDLRQLGNITVSPYVGTLAIITRNKLVYFLIASVITLFIPHVRMKAVSTYEAALAFVDAGATRPLAQTQKSEAVIAISNHL